MEQRNYLYVMISETDTGVGRIIRQLSGYRYNHVSVTTDSSFRNWYSFARYYENAPFFSGFLKEPVERFLAKGYDVPVRIFRLEIPQEKAKTLELLFSKAGRFDTGLRYNYYDALAAVFRKKIRIPGAYTCLSFSCAVMEKDYLTIEALNDDLQDYLYYDGPLDALAADSGCRTDRYFLPMTRSRCFLSTAQAMACVTYRLLSHSHEDMLQNQLHSTVF